MVRSSLTYIPGFSAQTLVDKQVKFQILSYKLGLGKSLTGLRLKKFKKPWAWAYPKKISTPE
jgi:hypothetical protein